MNKTGWIIFSAIVVLILGGMVVWTRATNPPIDVSNVENNSIIAASSDNGNIADHTKGSDKNKLILVEYGDYQCPGCATAHPNIKSLVEDYKDDLTFVFRNFPLTSIHPNALAAAAAVEAAGLQGKFWEMHDLVYDNQSDWSSVDATKRTDIFNQYASSLSLNLDTFKSDLAGKDVSQKIKFDIAVGKELNVAATPTFFLNGEKLNDSEVSSITQGDLKAVKEKIDSVLKK